MTVTTVFTFYSATPAGDGKPCHELLVGVNSIAWGFTNPSTRFMAI
ncbi:MAG: hypothetical protein ABSD13_14025 [Candidatus Korobacteraceae bacterium]|jgi:hypothetical protein